MSEISLQPLPWTTVKRSVALDDETWAVVLSEVGESIVALPETTLQVLETTGNRPGVAWPWSAKAVEAPWVHWSWSGPASLPGPSRTEYWMGVIKSVLPEEVAADDLVLTMMVFTPIERQG